MASPAIAAGNRDRACPDPGDGVQEGRSTIGGGVGAVFELAGAHFATVSGLTTAFRVAEVGAIAESHLGFKRWRSRRGFATGLDQARGCRLVIGLWWPHRAASAQRHARNAREFTRLFAGLRVVSLTTTARSTSLPANPVPPTA